MQRHQHSPEYTTTSHPVSSPLGCAGAEKFFLPQFLCVSGSFLHGAGDMPQFSSLEGVGNLFTDPAFLPYRPLPGRWTTDQCCVHYFFQGTHTGQGAIFQNLKMLIPVLSQPSGLLSAMRAPPNPSLQAPHSTPHPLLNSGQVPSILPTESSVGSEPA